MAPVDEWRILPETDAVIAELQRAIGDLGLHAVKFCPPHAYLGNQEPWDDGPFRPFWEAATALGVPVFFTLGSGPAGMAGEDPPGGERQEYPGRAAHPHPLDGALPRHRLLPHPRLPVAALPSRAAASSCRRRSGNPSRGPSCHLEVCFPVRLGDLFDFPWREVWPTLEEMVSRMGSDRLLWGTDMPFQNRFCTYRQSRRWIEHSTATF